MHCEVLMREAIVRTRKMMVVSIPVVVVIEKRIGAEVTETVTIVAVQAVVVRTIVVSSRVAVRSDRITCASGNRQQRGDRRPHRHKSEILLGFI